MFQINFNTLVTDQLPQEKRTTFNRDLQLFWLSQIRAIHNDCYDAGKLKYNEARATAQIGSMVRYLNDVMGVVGIYITEPTVEAEEYIYLDEEPYQNLPVFMDSETTPPAEDVYLFDDSESNPFDFTIHVPSSLNNAADIELLNYYINQVSLTGLNYNIEFI